MENKNGDVVFIARTSVLIWAGEVWPVHWCGHLASVNIVPSWFWSSTVDTGQATDTRGCQDWLSNWSYTNRFILCLDWITACILKNSYDSFHTQYPFQGYWKRCISIWWCSKRYIYKSWLQNVNIDDILLASWSVI